MKGIVNNKRRISILGLIKFIAAVAIVYYHTIDPWLNHWGSLFLLVELFFFITGYFTYKHFSKNNAKDTSLEAKSKCAIKYTIDKVRPLAPYIIIAVILHFVAMIILAMRSHTIKSSILNAVIKSIMDIFLLGSQLDVNNWAFWFISAMVIALPPFCIICQLKQKWTQLVAFMLLGIIYYFNVLNLDVIYGISAVARAFIGLCMGGLICIIADIISNAKCTSNRYTKTVASIVLILLFIGSFLMMYPTRSSIVSRQCQSLAVFLLILFMILLMSGRTLLSDISNGVMDLLEKISMVIFFIHWPIIQIAAIPLGQLDIVKQRCILVVSSVIIACIVYVAVAIASRIIKKSIVENN